MEKNNTTSAPNSSVCGKIRQALAGNPAVRIINRISSHNQEPKHATYGSSSTSSSSSPINTTPIQTKPHIPQQHVKANTEASGSIPIKFDYSTPTPTEKGKNSHVPNSHGQAAKVPPPPFVTNSGSATKVAAKGEPQQHVHGHGHGHHGVHFDQQGKQSKDINDTFSEYIQRAKKKIRTMSNLGQRGQDNTAQDHHESHGGAANQKEHHTDPFSDFIHHAKKKLRTTTIVGRSSSLRKG